MAELPLIGVVAIGRNEGERLRRCLVSATPDFNPTVYVDSGSTDGSRELARGLGASVVNLDLAQPFTAARARNAGFAALIKANPDIEFVQFVDGDCEFEPGWIASAAEFLLANPDVAAVCGRRRERFPQASLFNLLADQEWDTPIGQTDACGGDALIRRAAFAGVGGYNAAIAAGEEPEMCVRLHAAGWKIWRLDMAMTIHDAAMQYIGQWWLRAVRSGMGYAQAWQATRGAQKPLYRRELSRAFAWTIGVAGLAFIAALIFGPPLLLIAPVLWAGQYARLAIRHGFRPAWLLLIGKFAEMQGIARYASQTLAGVRKGTIFYK